jgi:hypothetical protein
MKTWKHLLALIGVAFVIGLLFLREPGFGDDLTYWSFAFDLHERGLKAWQVGSFHDLRWPVWGVCWVLQAIFGFGLVSFYGVPLLYLAGGAVLGFTFGKKILGSAAAGWACGVAFLFQPLLDTVAYRPMPDLSEGVWGAAVMLAWWQMMQAQSIRARLGFGVLVGAAVFLAESNRITGVFIIPVLIVATMMFFRRRLGWLILAGVVALALYAAEAAFYHRLFENWLHNLHAHMGAKGVKGTESIPVWYLPFRFFDTLWKGNPLAPAYCILGAIGTWVAWQRHGVLGRVIVVWFATLYLGYSCAPQSLSPWRPLIRDADRFLCGLVVPFSILAVIGLWTLLELRRVREVRALERLRSHSVLTGAAAILLMVLITSRSFFDLGFVPEFRRYMATVPDGARVFSHKSMREITYLVDAGAAARFQWTAPNAILEKKPELEAAAAECDEFWYARKLIWLNRRKQLERKKHEGPTELASYFNAPEQSWQLTRLLAKGDNPDLIFYRRRAPGTPPPLVLSATAPEWQGLTGTLPASWRSKEHERTILTTWYVPAALRGKLGRIELIAASEQVEAVTVRLRFFSGPNIEGEFLLKPYLHPEPSKEFFALEVPENADRCEIQLKFSKNAEYVLFSDFRAVLE